MDVVIGVWRVSSAGQTKAVADRLLALSWERRLDREYSRVQLMKEYLRRAAACVVGRAPVGWPFFDVSAAVDRGVRADPALVDRVVRAVRGAGEPGTIADTCAWALHWAELSAIRRAGLGGLPDPFAPLILLYERGGDFTGNGAGMIEVDRVGIPPRSPAELRDIEPIASLDPAVLDALDAEWNRRHPVRVTRPARPVPARPTADAGRLVVRLRGTLDDAGLQSVRAALGLSRRGRLGDSEDEEFGHRDLGRGGAYLSLWRHEPRRWSVTLDYGAADGVDLALVDRISGEITAAAVGAGLIVESRRHFPPAPGPDGGPS